MLVSGRRVVSRGWRGADVMPRMRRIRDDVVSAGGRCGGLGGGRRDDHGAVRRARLQHARLPDDQGEPEGQNGREWPKPPSPTHSYEDGDASPAIPEPKRSEGGPVEATTRQTLRFGDQFAGVLAYAAVYRSDSGAMQPLLIDAQPPA